jgi:FkbM family methyltransferase
LASFRESLKAVVLAYAPARVLTWLKKRHYAHALPAFDEPDAKVIRAMIRPGDRVIDIGSNAGWYTYVLSQRVGPSGRVTSIEPIPPTFEILCHCVSKLDLRNVDTLNCAISNQPGMVRMELPDFDGGGENFYQARIVSADPEQSGHGGYEVESRTLDSLCESEDGKVHFIKCDVEGHELSVIEGAAQLIARDQPAWMLEVSGNPDSEGSRAQRVVHALSKLGYGTYWFDGMALRERAAGDQSVNYFFFTKAQRDELASRGMPIRASAG